MPFLNYRQLVSDGRLPDSIGGREVTVPIIRSATINYRQNPADIIRPDTALHILYEAMPKRVGLETPPDVFRLTDKIEFIDIESNKVDEKKSRIFQTALEKAGFVFPAQWASGNPQIRKPYDEGYFCLDAAGQLYHMKMVNNRPFVRNTRLGEEVDIRWFSLYESPNKRFYGFLFDQQGKSCIVEDGGGKYDLVRMDIDSMDIGRDRIVIMGNLLYWTVTITRPDGADVYGLDTETLERLDEYHFEKEAGLWEKVASLVFPWYLTIKGSDSKYNFPVFHFTGWTGVALSLLLAAGYMVIWGRKRKKGVLYALYILLTGITGCLLLGLIPDVEE